MNDVYIYPVIAVKDNTIYKNPNGPVISNKDIGDGICSCQESRYASLMVTKEDRVIFCNNCKEQIIPSKESQ